MTFAEKLIAVFGSLFVGLIILVQISIPFAVMFLIWKIIVFLAEKT